MGYGFVEYKTPTAAKQALKLLQHTMLDGHQLELKLSNRTTLCVSRSVFQIKIFETDCDNFCHMILCCHALSVRPSIHPSITFVNSVKTNKHFSKKFSSSGSHTILVFPYQTSWQYSDGDALSVSSFNSTMR